MEISTLVWLIFLIVGLTFVFPLRYLLQLSGAGAAKLPLRLLMAATAALLAYSFFAEPLSLSFVLFSILVWIIFEYLKKAPSKSLFKLSLLFLAGLVFGVLGKFWFLGEISAILAFVSLVGGFLAVFIQGRYED